MPVAATTAPTEADRVWFGDCARAMLPELYGTARRLCGSHAEAEDLVAGAIAKAWEALPSLQDRAAVRAWIFRILNNDFVSSRRTLRSRTDHEPLLPDTDELSLFERLHQPILLWWGNPETDFLNRLLREDLEKAIDGLPGTYRTVVVLVELQGLTYRQIAELLGIPVGTVRSRLARGRRLLQRALWEDALDQGLRVGPPPPQGRGHA